MNKPIHRYGGGGEQAQSSLKCRNPFSFVPMSVTSIILLGYLAVLVPLLLIHETVPPAPTDPTIFRGLNITEAWFDLQTLSDGFHPFNSRRNDQARSWLLTRIENILDGNGADYTIDGTQNIVHGADTSQSIEVLQDTTDHDELRVRSPRPSAVVFNDLVANYTSTALTHIGQSGRRAGISTYFEGNNIIVYIRGKEDEAGDWWMEAPPFGQQTRGKGGIMVNAHFDSVSTGFGTTDDGMGVVTTLQLIKYFTTEGNTPKRGIVALLNNGEEDGLYGAKAFLSHPMAAFVHAFLNLEGAGAGGRATLFRSTDTEVTRAYSYAPHPLGSVVSADGFALGFVRSETDYVVFRAEGYRGLDVAFWEPRARYHTDEDDIKHASKDSLWHMLSASVETIKYLASNTDKFIGPRGDNDANKVRNGHGTDGVWFDLLGSFMAVFPLRTLFAWSLVLLIAAPLALLIISYILHGSDKYYLFTSSVKPLNPPDLEGSEILIKGWWGVFRFPIAFAVSVALTFGAVFLVEHWNPLVIYSSQYAVWAMSMSVFFCSFWSIMSLFDLIRPSALHRVYSLIWMFALGWLLTVAATVCEDRFKIGGGYMFVIYETVIFLATFIGLCELFALRKKSDIPELGYESDFTGYDSLFRPIYNERDRIDGASGSPNETTPLMFGRAYRRQLTESLHDQGDGPASPQHEGQVDGTSSSTMNNQPYAGTSNNQPYLTSNNPDIQSSRFDREPHRAYGKEQTWSDKLPTWTWLIQFIILGPVILGSLGQVGLFLVTATSQTGTDGSPLILPYLIVALFSVLLILPISPFIHRINSIVPIFFSCILVATLLYNLWAFPFSANNRYKTYFQQTVDLDTGINNVTLAGIEVYIREIISGIPSASGQTIDCTQRPMIRDGLSFCSYHSLSPKVVDNVKDGVPPEKGFTDWLTYNVTRVEGHNKATFHISGLETKACIIRFNEPFSKFHVKGAAPSDGRWADVPETGSDQIKLWHRDWNREWEVDVEWPIGDGKKAGDEGRSGRVVCLWSDHNLVGVIPALDEAVRFAPAWTSIVKLMDGLVEGSKAFEV